MNIETVKMQDDGWLVNGSLFVPSDPSNRHYQLIQEWIDAGNIPSPEFTQTELDQKAIEAAKLARDKALNDLVYDFGDGRIIQVRPQDESNIRNAIEVINNEPLIDAINWRMADNTVSSVSAADLQAALNSGQLQALAIWDAYNGA